MVRRAWIIFREERQPMESMTSRTRSAAAILIAATGFFCAIPDARAQLIDAGGQANLMQQHELLRNQTTGDGPDWVEPGDDRAVPAKPVRQDGARNREAAMRAEMRRMFERRRRELLPEYERRVRADGRASADAWLKQVATEMGRRDGEAIRARFGH